jgi:DNA repair photolyase
VGRISHPELFPLEAERGPSPQPFRIIHTFEKTPPNIVCGRFWELRWAFGYPYNCAYCYLRGSRKGNMKPAIIKPEAVLKELAEAFCAPTFNAGASAIFNSGELSDFLMNPKVMATIADFFETQRKHRLLVLTKSGIKAINEFASKPRKQTICAWSVNPPAIASRWEQRAAAPEDRLEAAKTAKSQGYEVRFRIYPIIPVEGWKHDYESLATAIAAVGPSRVVIGTPRGLHKTILYASLAGLDMGWASYFDSQETGWGMKLPPADLEDRPDHPYVATDPPPLPVVVLLVLPRHTNWGESEGRRQNQPSGRILSLSKREFHSNRILEERVSTEPHERKSQIRSHPNLSGCRPPTGASGANLRGR